MTPRRARMPLASAVLLLPLALAPAAGAQVAVSSNDNKVALVDGVVTIVKNPAPDTATFIDLGVYPPKVIAEINVPA